MSCTIETKEGKCIDVTYIRGALLHTNMEQDIHMLLECTIAELIVRIEQNTEKLTRQTHIIHEA